MKQVPERNEQFENIARLKAEFQAAGDPIVSMDTKKKEYLGNLYREGRLYTRETIQVYDHDFTSLADGVVIPHGIYDVQRNSATIHLGTSHDTSQFACDCLRSWWLNQGQVDYPTSKSLLVLCDGGGSNNSRHYIFKQDLQALADELDIEIRIAHYPPYTSKYNPIEHQLFPHVTRACQGVVFKSVELVKRLSLVSIYIGFHISQRQGSDEMTLPVVYRDGDQCRFSKRGRTDEPHTDCRYPPLPG